jgi:bidirectional [NiFe] hydrogenase diaphorase subunit
MVRLTINEQQIEMPEGRTLLEACREIGVEIPTLCYHPALKPYGACRLCMVDVAMPPRPPRLVAACVYPCEEGAVVQTESEAARRSRRMTAELLMATAGESPEIRSIAEKLGVTEVRFRLPADTTCVLCGLCVRACTEIVGVSAISIIERGISKKISAPFQIASSRCIGCGTCVLICPTNAFQFSEVAGFHNVEPTLEGTRLGYYRVSGELDFRPDFVQDVFSLLKTQYKPDEQQE